MRIFISVAAASLSESKRITLARRHEAQKDRMRAVVDDLEEHREFYSNQLEELKMVQAAREQIGYGRLRPSGRELAKKLKLRPNTPSLYVNEAVLKNKIASVISSLADAEADLKKAENKLAKLEAKG